MKPSREVLYATQAMEMTSSKAKSALFMALNELLIGGGDAHIALGHAEAALQCLSDLRDAQDMFNALRVCGRA